MLRKIILNLTIMLGLVGCSTMKPEDFTGTEPRLILEDYFSGQTKAWGIFQDRFGNLRRQFVVDIAGDWDGETLTLTEDFVYDDGELDQRIWRIRKIDENTYEGRADDVVGVAQGRSFGNALKWSYDLNLKVGDGTWRVHFNDWMFLQDQEVMINKADVSKFGINIGQVTLVFRKIAQAPEQTTQVQEDNHVLAAQ